MRYHGKVGFTTTVDKGDGVYISQITERNYTGDITTNYYSRNDDNQVNDNIKSNNILSLIADDYLIRHHSYIKYAEVYGIRWEVGSVNLSNLPRIVLTLGAPYSGEDNEEDEDNG